MRSSIFGPLYSIAPISYAVPKLALASPLWSFAGALTLVPASIAALQAKGKTVGVAPPLS